jgi:transcriptional regulator with XRE-family HTH domain
MGYCRLRVVPLRYVTMPETTIPDLEVGERLKLFRERRGLNQDDVARRCKVDPKTYRGWEKGRGRPSEVMLRGLASLFEVPVESIIGPTSDMCPYPQLALWPDDGAEQQNGTAWKILPSSTGTEQRNEREDSRPRRSAATERTTRRSRPGLSDAA